MKNVILLLQFFNNGERMKEILVFLACAFGLFVLMLLFNGLKAKFSARKLSERPKHKTLQEQTDYALKLSKMIKCETVCDPQNYNDTEFKKLREVMAELFPLVHKAAEKITFGDDCWIYKINGKDKSRNIMIMSHHDVVAAEGEWLHPGFCGEIFDGALWGRGTVDTKTPLFAEFQAIEELLNEGFIPECNLFIGSSHNEEIGGDGIPLAVEHFKQQGISFEAVLDEGGAIISPPLPGIKHNCAMMAVHEKGRYTLNCYAKEGNSHKGLAANANTPVARMSAFITEINTKNIFIKRLYPEVKAMFSHLCPYTPFIMTVLFSNLWCFGSLLKTIMPKINAQAGSMVGTTCSFNEINMNKEEKVCSAKAFIRPINKEDLEKDLKSIKKIADKYDIFLEPAPHNECFTPADMNHKAFSYTKNCIAEIFPDVISAPYILPAGTDARHLCEICPCVIRFAPIEMNNQQFASVHSENENISLESIANCVVFYKNYIKNYK